jgi:DNA-binding beta-propeller fold protein YncE
MRLRLAFIAVIVCIGAILLISVRVAAQTPARVLLVLEKNGSTLDIIDPVSLKILAKAPAGPDPHEVIASADGALAYVSNYGGPLSGLHTISVVDLVAQKPLPAIELGVLHGAHGLDFAGGELYFTAEVNKAIGRYDPATQKIDWVMGTGQDRTHMVWVSRDLNKIITSNVNSGTISIIEATSPPRGGFGPPPTGGNAGGVSGPPPGGPQPGNGNRKSWEVTNVAVGRGSEGFDVSLDGSQIWAANAYDATVSIIDIASKKVIQTLPIAVMGANRLKFTLDGRFVLISGSGASEPGGAAPTPDLLVLDAATHAEVKQFKLGGAAGGILMDAEGSRAFVAVSGGNKVEVLDLKTLNVVGEIAPLGQPDGMAWAVRK